MDGGDREDRPGDAAADGAERREAVKESRERETARWREEGSGGRRGEEGGRDQIRVLREDLPELEEASEGAAERRSSAEEKGEERWRFFSFFVVAVAVAAAMGVASESMRVSEAKEEEDGVEEEARGAKRSNGRDMGPGFSKGERERAMSM